MITYTSQARGGDSDTKAVARIQARKTAGSFPLIN